MPSLLRRRLMPALTLVALLALAGCGSSHHSGTNPGAATTTQTTVRATLDKVTIVVNWYAQAEQGGYWQAVAEDLDGEHGIDLHVQQGGPGTRAIPLVIAGKAKFAMLSAGGVLLARAQGVPVVEVFGVMDRSLRCVMFHPDQKIEKWTDLDGHRLAVKAGTHWWKIVMHKYHLQNMNVINYMGSLAPFAHDAGLVQQCFITNEPYVARQAGIPAATMMVASSGYNPYSQGLFTTEKVIREQPDLVRRVVASVQQGWANFLKDPEAARRLILKVNPEMTAGRFDYAWKVLSGGGYFADPIGSMTAKRWQTLADQLRETGVLTKNIDVGAAWTNWFLPQCVQRSGKSKDGPQADRVVLDCSH